MLICQQKFYVLVCCMSVDKVSSGVMIILEYNNNNSPSFPVLNEQWHSNDVLGEWKPSELFCNPNTTLLTGSYCWCGYSIKNTGCYLFAQVKLCFCHSQSCAQQAIPLTPDEDCSFNHKFQVISPPHSN